jgi:hypothetical protein
MAALDLDLNRLRYEDVVAQWCRATGQLAQRVGADLHLDMCGTPVSLVHGGTKASDMLCVFFDLGYPEGVRRLGEKLLELNAPLQPPVHGYFALDPIIKSVIYRVNVPLRPETDGAALSRVMARVLHSARQSLAAIAVN